MPFHEALVSPTLWLGCDPVLLIALATASAVVGLLGGIGFEEPLLGVLGLLMFWGGRKGLLAMASQDPQLRQIYQRAKEYDDVYDACSRWDIRSPEPRRWL